MDEGKLNKYRVTFLTTNGTEQRTVLEAHSLPHCIQKTESIMADAAGYFINDKKNNTYFTVLKQNIAYIQYELLFSNREVHLEKLRHVPPEAMQQLFQIIRDPEVYALALGAMDAETRAFILQYMPEDLQAQAAAYGQQQWQRGSMEAYQAQELLLDAITTIIRDK